MYGLIIWEASQESVPTSWDIACNTEIYGKSTILILEWSCSLNI